MEAPPGAQPWLFLGTSHHKRAFALFLSTPTELPLAAKSVILETRGPAQAPCTSAPSGPTFCLGFSPPSGSALGQGHLPHDTQWQSSALFLWPWPVHITALDPCRASPGAAALVTLQTSFPDPLSGSPLSSSSQSPKPSTTLPCSLLVLPACNGSAFLV